MNLVDHLNVLLFVVVYPTYVFFSYRKVKSTLVENIPESRVKEYKETIFWLWLLGIMTVVIWLSNERLISALRLELSFSWTLLIAALLFLVTPVLLWSMFHSTKKNDTKRATIKEKLDKAPASEFLPKTKKEFQWFILLSITAGICEELLFRGFLMWYFETLTNTVLAVLFSSILFGLAHSYQGIAGFLQSGFMGLILALLLVWTDSLLIPIFLHIAGDVYNGIIGRLGYGDFKKIDLENDYH